MPNHFLTIGLCSRDWSEDQGEVDFSALKDANLCQLVHPQPEGIGDGWYHWSIENWGTKWGTYDTKVHELGGDGSPILIEFQSAWGPPSPSTMRKITDYLRKTYRLKQIDWSGHDPSCDEIVEIEVAEAE